MTKLGIFYSAIAIVFGVTMFVFGGYDDSPGAQGLGLIATILGITGVSKSIKKRSS